MDYKQLEPGFTCVLTSSGTALGFRFATLEQETLFIQHMETLLQLLEGTEFTRCQYSLQ